MPLAVYFLLNIELSLEILNRNGFTVPLDIRNIHMITAPHAYSSDTLQKAYKWLQDNPQYQESIHNSDQLVALYLSEKKGLQSFDFTPPTSSSTFFLDQQTSAASIDNIKPQARSLKNPKQNPPTIVEPKFTKPQTPAKVKNLAQPILDNTLSSKVELNQKASTTDSFLALDEKSLSYLEDTKKTFNLSTQSEALRLLLSIGYEKLHKI